MRTCYNCNSEINDIYNFCPHCGVNQKELKCHKCSYINEPNSKFCQECGSKLTKESKTTSSKTKDMEDVEVIIAPIPDTGITIEFNYSSSQTFEFALEEARKFSTYSEYGEGKKAVYRVHVNDDEVEKLDNLVDNMKGWRNRKVYHNGDKIPWDSVFSFKWCFSQRNASYKPELYCFGYENDYEFNLWGCLRTHLGFNESSDLFTYGKWLNTKADC